MSRNSTLARLRADVENQADIVGAASRYPPTLLNRLINQSIQRFRERISNEGITHYLTATTGTLSSGTTSPYPFQVLDLSAVSPGVVRTLGVDITVQGSVYSLKHVPFEERASFGTHEGQPLAWAHFQTAKIAILPAPDTGYDYTVWYLPVLSDLSAESDTFDGVAGWEDFIVWDVVSRLTQRDTYQAAHALAKQESAERLADIIRSATKVTAAGGTHTGRDTFGQLGFLPGRRRGPPHGGGGGTNIPNDSVTNAKLAEMAAYTIKGNPTAALANPTDLTTLQANQLLVPSVYRVRDYGALGDGSTDDTAAIQAAIDACEAGRTGVVKFEASEYCYTSLTVDTNNVVLEGTGDIGDTGTVLVKTSTTGDGITVSAQNSGLRNLTLRQRRSGSPPTAGYAVTFSSCFCGFYENLRITEMYNGVRITGCLEFRGQGTLWLRDMFGTLGVDVDGVSGFFQRVVADNPYPEAPEGKSHAARGAATAYVVGDTYTNNGIIYQCTGAGTSDAGGGPTTVPGSTVANARSTAVTDGTATFKFVGRLMIWMTGGASVGGFTVQTCALLNGYRAFRQTGGNWWFFNHLEFDHQWTDAILLEGGSGFRAANTAWISSVFAGHGVNIGVGYTGDVHFAGGRVFGVSGHGILLQPGPVNCHFTDMTLDTCAGGFGFVAGSVAGAGPKHWSLTNTRSTNNTHGVVVLASDANHYQIIGNNLQGNSTAEISDGGTGTTKTVQSPRSSLPVFSGSGAGLVPTGGGSTSLYLNQAGSWGAPSVGGTVSGVTNAQLNFAPPLTVKGRFTIGTGAVEDLSRGQVASLIAPFTTTTHGLVPFPTGGANGFVLKDDGTWAAVSGGGGAANNPGGPTGSVQFNQGSGIFGGASGFRFSTSTGLALHGELRMPTGTIQFHPEGVNPGGVSSGFFSFSATMADVIVARTAAGAHAQLMQWSVDGSDVLTIGRNAAIAKRFNRVNQEHRWLVNGANRAVLDGTHLGMPGGVRLGLGQLAHSDANDKLGAWTASGFANIATGITIQASGMGITVASGPYMHASGIDTRNINSATVCAPLEGSEVTTTATINVGQGNQRKVSSEGGAYSLTLGTTGSPFTGEGITLVATTALANAITVVNGGAGGGNIGFSGGTIPAAFKGSVSFYYDGTNWALAHGSIIRFL